MRFAALRALAGLVRIDRRALAAFAAASALGSVLPMLSVLLLHQFLAGVLGHGQGLSATIAGSVGPTAAIWILAALLLVTFLASAAIGFYTEVVQERLVRTIELAVMERLVRHLLALSVLTLDRHSPGDLIEAVREDVQKLRAVVVSFAAGAVRVLTTGALVASAIWLSPSLAAMAFPILLLAAVPVMLAARGVRGRSYALRRSAYKVFDVMLQVLRGIRVIKVYGAEGAEADRAIAHMRRYYRDLVGLARARAFGQVALEALGGFSVVVIVVAGGFQVLRGSLDWPSLLAFLIAVRATQGPLLQLNSHLLQLQRNAAAVDRLQQLLAEVPAPSDAPDALPLAGDIRTLALDRVSFAYDTGTPAVADVSFDLARGEVVGVAGPSAAGKTTLLNLAARFFDPASGAVLINGVDIRRYRLADLYAQIALVTQEPFLFSTTVRENIRCGRPDASDDEVEAAAQAAEIHQEILALPKGYATVVGTGHRGLSGGQIQRINIARAILKNAPLLLLDEATSSLDSLAEARVQRALARLMRGRATLVVAHRLSTLRPAAKIVVLDRGRVAAIGPHDTLLATSPLYRRMWDAQHHRATADDDWALTS